MTLLFPPILLLVVSIAIFIFHHRRIRPAISWLVGFVGVLAAWIVVLVLHSQIPTTFTLPMWQIPESFTFLPQLILDDFSWPYTVSIASLALVGMVVSLVNQATLSPGSEGWKEWVVVATIAGISLLAVYPADFITLVITWTVLDLVEGCIWIGAGNRSQPGARPVLFLASRLAGTFLVIWATVLSLANGFPLSIQQLHPSLVPLVIIALGIRTGVLPLNLPPASVYSANETRGVLLTLAPQAAGLVLVSRIAALSQPGDLRLWLLFLSLFVLFSSLAWISAPEEERFRVYWLSSVSGLALAASSQALTGASLAWGNALLLTGGLVMLASRQVRFLQALFVLGAFSISSLPYSLTWQGVSLFRLPMGVPEGILMVSQLILLVGFLRLSRQERQGISPAEPWKPIMYFSGLLLLPIITAVIYFQNPILSGSDMRPSLLQTWPAFLFVAVCLAGLFLSRRFKFSFRRAETIVTTISSVGGIRRSGNLLFQGLGKFFSLINYVLEGQAGVLWAFLILILLVSLMAQFGAGG